MVFNLYTAWSVALKPWYVKILTTMTWDDEFSSCLYLGRFTLFQVEESARSTLG